LWGSEQLSQSFVVDWSTAAASSTRLASHADKRNDEGNGGGCSGGDVDEEGDEEEEEDDEDEEEEEEEGKVMAKLSAAETFCVVESATTCAVEFTTLVDATEARF
jgi:hypothetical protein